MIKYCIKYISHYRTMIVYYRGPHQEYSWSRFETTEDKNLAHLASTKTEVDIIVSIDGRPSPGWLQETRNKIIIEQVEVSNEENAL